MIMHLITQHGQPYGSVRKCCEKCGINIKAIPVGDGYYTERNLFNKNQAIEDDTTLCTDYLIRHKGDE